MRRYQKWLTVGLLALTTPGMVFAGSGAAKQGVTARAQSANTGKSAKQAANQEVANRIQKALQSSDVQMDQVEILVSDGKALLKGRVATPNDRKAAEAIAKKVKGVTAVRNSLEVAPPAVAQKRDPRGKARQVAYQPDYDGVEPSESPVVPPNPGYEGAPSVMQSAPGAVPGGMPAYGAPGMPGPGGMPAYGAPGMGGPMPMPAYGGPATGGPNTIYNQPNLPNYSWPSYAQYPNYSAVSYPSQYSASAWPYIGPFYPYPQVPLGWRKAQLEWDDGYWHLNFSPRTERWWWFLDWRNW